MVLKGFSPLHDGLSTSVGISDLGVAVLELLATRILSQPFDMAQNTNQAASCVLEFRLQQKPRGGGEGGVKDTYRFEGRFDRRFVN